MRSGTLVLYALTAILISACGFWPEELEPLAASITREVSGEATAWRLGGDVVVINVANSPLYRKDSAELQTAATDIAAQAIAFAAVPLASVSVTFHEGDVSEEAEKMRDASITNETAKRLDWVTIGLVVMALSFIAVDRLWLSPGVSLPVETASDESVGDTQMVTTDEQAHSDLGPSIAVLPFANRSANPDDAYFVDGIHDDLLTYISKISAIKTISRTSVMRYRNSDKTIPEIASELGVSTVLEGGVQRAGQQIRINVQLIDAQSDEHLWAEIYDRHLSAGNIFAIQSEISKAISEALQAVLSPAEQRRLQAIPTESLEAYESYLLGKQRMARRDTESLKEAVDYLSKAVEMDPQFALAWSTLGDTYLLQRQHQ